MTRPTDFQAASFEEWRLACRREAIIRPLTEADQLSRGQVDHAARALGLGRSATYQLIARFKQRPRLRALVREIARRCAEQQLPVPTFRTVRSRLAALDPQQVTKARLGARKAQELYRPVQAWPTEGLLPLGLVQIDHTQLDVIVVDEGRRRTLGRPWLTLAIDVASRVVTGFYVSLDAPAAVSVALALTQAVLPKDLWLADRQLDLSWPVAGIPERLHLDNAPGVRLPSAGAWSPGVRHRPGAPAAATAALWRPHRAADRHGHRRGLPVAGHHVLQRGRAGGLPAAANGSAHVGGSGTLAGGITESCG